MRRFLSLLASFAGLAFADSRSALQLDSSRWIDPMPSDSSAQGWTRLPFPAGGHQSPDSQWRVDPETRYIVCNGDKHVEWRFAKLNGSNPRYNSGIYIRNNSDASIWLQAQAGALSGGFLFGDTPVGGVIVRVGLRSELKDERLKQVGDWNTFEVTAVGPRISVWTNGAVTNVFEHCEVRSGFVGLEAEGYKIELRNIKLKELP